MPGVYLSGDKIKAKSGDKPKPISDGKITAVHGSEIITISGDKITWRAGGGTRGTEMPQRDCNKLH